MVLITQQKNYLDSSMCSLLYCLQINISMIQYFPGISLYYKYANIPMYLKYVCQGFHLADIPSKATFLASPQNNISRYAVCIDVVFQSNILENELYFCA